MITPYFIDKLCVPPSGAPSTSKSTSRFFSPSHHDNIIFHRQTSCPSLWRTTDVEINVIIFLTYNIRLKLSCYAFSPQSTSISQKSLIRFSCHHHTSGTTNQPTD
eukprot:TRINITY_DN476_c0_g1_i6.p1 TRINITY_DN476_c0_g1~~TRINITY_DN476_c0_g1_i6.p1  ORF type:complete len:105 (+),score=0.43 TRINITY_DN476_c0_g1_i6:175-489(+)